MSLPDIQQGELSLIFKIYLSFLTILSDVVRPLTYVVLCDRLLSQ